MKFNRYTILFKKWAKHKVKSYIYNVNQFCPKNATKHEGRNVNKSSLFCSIFDLLTCKTEKIAW